MEYRCMMWSWRACLVMCLVHVGSVCAQLEGDVRLVDGISNSNQGRVEIFHDGTWGTACNKDWGDEEATVVCRQMDLGEVLLSKAFFGNGSGPIYVGAHCHDHDFHINECHGSWEEVPTTCTHEDDVAVICYPENHEEAATGISLWNEMIIVIAFGVFCLLFIKVVKFLEDSKDAVDLMALEEARTEDHPHAASQHVSTADECDLSASEKKGVSCREKEGVSSSKDDTTASKSDVAGSKNDVNNNETEEVDERYTISKDIQSTDVSVQTLE
ncbi:scavenger receptor cysteine-rich type 1 protein M130 [Strongylocentrotus purpuratus]|uniref:SRCR domain-containing protein n=1 Tax=Strongylocentrotus purpuratus TaxID=7668 RepID=A0A7M7GH50_STRPU|nr:scavenger receptor cysteine-rich type 1 protein M130 [Strongylocentrotus purpuratus]|eukprot:XP_003728655.1 PREDICTED: scavenger receptor cysteine-rich type 1 protein M130 [Strongylocentrotus purpuratus]